MALAIFASFAFAAGYVASGSIGATGAVAHPDAGDQNTMTWENWITVTRTDGQTGETEVVARFHNVLTDQGQDWIQDQIASSTDVVSNDLTNATYIALGNGTAPVAATTQLADEIGYQEGDAGLTRKTADVETYFGGAGNFSMEATWTATSDIGVVNTTSLNFNSTGPSIVSGGAFGTEANILTDDQLTVTHNISIS